MIGVEQSEGKWRKTWQIRVEQEYWSGEEWSEKRGAKREERSRVRRSKRSEKSREDKRERCIKSIVKRSEKIRSDKS